MKRAFEFGFVFFSTLSGLVIGMALVITPWYGGLLIYCFLLALCSAALVKRIGDKVYRRCIWLVAFVSALSSPLIAFNIACNVSQRIPPACYENITLGQLRDLLNQRLGVSGVQVVIADKSLLTNTVSIAWNTPVRISKLMRILDDRMSLIIVKELRASSALGGVRFSRYMVLSSEDEESAYEF